MDGLEITQALFFVAMLAMFFPRVKRALQNPSESSGKWGDVLIPLLIVLAIVALLISFVR